MKNFFKKLAFVLALAMVVTAIAPAAKASAATEPQFKYTSKKLYIGGDKTGTYGDTYRFTFTNAKGYTATWKSSKPSVATVDAKTGEIQAVAVGTTVIKATLKNKAGDVVERTAKVYVKQNAEKIGFGSTAAVKDMAIGDTGKVNVYRQVGDTKVWKQADKTLITDVVKWTSSDTSVATVDKWGKVTAVGAGEAKITATATQSEGSKAVVSKSYKVTVKAGLTDAKQSGLDTIAATFAGDLSAVVTKDNIKVYQVVGATKVNVVVKSVKFDDTDKTKATITVYNTFAKDAEYVVEYADTTASFKGADTSANAVASIKITTTEAKPNEAKEIEFKVYDANGVDITTKDLTDRITVSIVGTNNDCYLDASAKTITFWVKDKAATVKASFHTYTYNEDFTEKTIDAQAVIVSKEKTSATVTSVGTATITSGDPDFSKATTNMSVKDQSSKIYLKTTNSDNKEVTSKDNAAFTFSSSDKTTLIVYSDGSLYPVKEGSAQVIVKYNDSVIGAVTVTIGGERKPATVTTSFDRTTLSKGTTANDKITLTIEIKDQYGSPVTTVTPQVDFVTGPANVAVTAISAPNSDGKSTVEFEGKNYTEVGQYQYKVTVDKQVRYVYFNVGDSKDAVSTYAFSNSGKNVDTALKYNELTNSVAFDMSLASYASNGYKVKDETVHATSGDAFGSIATTGTAIYVEVLDKDGKVVALDGSNDFVKFGTNDEGNTAILIDPVNVDATGKVTKLKNGNYTVKAILMNKKETSTTITGASLSVIAMTNFVVTDSQKAVTVTINGTNSTQTPTTVFADEAVATLKIGDVKVNALTTVDPADVIGTGKEVAIKKATVAVPVNYAGDTGNYMQEVAIGVTVNFK